MMANRRTFYRPFLACCWMITFLWQFPARAQTREKTRQDEVNLRHRRARHATDSLWKKDFLITDTSAALIINRIQDINSTLNDINDILENGYDTSEISENLPEFERSVKIIRYNISNLSSSQNLGSLSLMQARLNEMGDDLKDWQESLLDYYTVLVGRNSQLKALSLDSTVHELPADTALRYLYLRQLHQLNLRRASTDSVTRKNLFKIDLLQSTVYNRYVEVADLQKKVRTLIKAYDKRALSNEYGYLWQPPDRDSATEGLGTVFRRSIKGSNRILQYHFEATRQTIFIDIGLTLLFFLWAFLNLRKLQRNQPGSMQQLQYMRSIPVLSTLIFLLMLTSFTDLHPPAIYTGLLQLLLAVSLTFLLLRRWPRRLFWCWLALAGLFLFYSAKNLLVTNTYSARLLTFGVNLFSIALGYIFLREGRKERGDGEAGKDPEDARGAKVLDGGKVREDGKGPEDGGSGKKREGGKGHEDGQDLAGRMDQRIFPGYFSVLPVIYMLLNLLAALSNLFGRVTLSQVLGSTAIFSFIQAIGLVVFIQIVLEGVFLQLEADKKSSRFSAYLNYQNVESRLRTILTLVAAVYWFINLSQDLNLYDQAYDGVIDFLITPRAVGSTSFTLSSILIFFVVIWLSNILQKYIGYFFGDTGEDITADKKTRLGTSILLIRLLVLTAGFLMGVLASGIPLDKVTIVIGALGVGIGLGLQNIVNNLVSGVILAIERPIQVGDLIEISGNSGRVKEIGIRSSRIVTAEGAEVIIPNGDMLSQKLTNWTLSNSHMRVEIEIKLGEGADLDKARNVLLDLLLHHEEIMTKPEPQVLFKSVTVAGAEVQLLFWAFDLNKGTQLKSELLQKIYEVCKAAEVPVVG